ncbi:uncharacterized protein LOC127865299 [Dreissena polymorpha]|uniref:uncharacterized protein LOC127865299 n=1 Tax=Dreissena polymorpha TaxID=45954 RepID=UPI0022644708|nr:uncharacterized protein LOC127865299 [Dreissena polymorpha]
MINGVVFSCLVAVLLVGKCWGQCPFGSPLPNFYCGRGGERCPDSYYCEIAPDDRYAVCCLHKLIKKTSFQSSNDLPLMENNGTLVYCGEDAVSCPSSYVL